MGNDKVTKTDIQKLATLARLSVSEQEAARLGDSIDEIMKWMGVLNRIEVKDIVPMTSAVHSDQGHSREDIVNSRDLSAQILQSAPQARSGFFVVPKVVE